MQDVHASPEICMSKIRDLPNYPKMVKNVKKVDIYSTNKFMNVRTLYSHFLDITYKEKLYTSMASSEASS